MKGRDKKDRFFESVSFLQYFIEITVAVECKEAGVTKFHAQI
jgi:hypothetical protein